MPLLCKMILISFFERFFQWFKSSLGLCKNGEGGVILFTNVGGNSYFPTLALLS